MNKMAEEIIAEIAKMEYPHNFQCERADIVESCEALTHAIKMARDYIHSLPKLLEKYKWVVVEEIYDGEHLKPLGVNNGRKILSVPDQREGDVFLVVETDVQPKEFIVSGGTYRRLPHST